MGRNASSSNFTGAVGVDFHNIPMNARNTNPRTKTVSFAREDRCCTDRFRRDRRCSLTSDMDLAPVNGKFNAYFFTECNRQWQQSRVLFAGRFRRNRTLTGIIDCLSQRLRNHLSKRLSIDARSRAFLAFTHVSKDLCADSR
jgi:hypothetical protein